MRQRYKVDVTEQDIRFGRGQSAVACPVSWATKRATGRDVLVTSDYIVLTGRVPQTFLEQRIPLPGRAREFIKAFDRETGYSRLLREDAKLLGALEPFEFEIDIKVDDPLPLAERYGPGLQM